MTVSLKQIDKIISHDNPFASKPKKEKKSKIVRYRIVVCGSAAWTNRKRILKTLKEYAKNAEFVVTGTSRGLELTTVSVCKELGIPLFQAHLWSFMRGSEYLSCGKVVSLLKPNLILCFDDFSIKNKVVDTYQKLAQRQDITFEVFRK